MRSMDSYSKTATERVMKASDVNFGSDGEEDHAVEGGGERCPLESSHSLLTCLLPLSRKAR